MMDRFGAGRCARQGQAAGAGWARGSTLLVYGGSGGGEVELVMGRRVRAIAAVLVR